MSALPLRKIHLRYFAILREQRGLTNETISTTAHTPSALYAELAARHSFALSTAQLRVAVNGEFADWSTLLRDGDEVVFIPPVAGG